MMHRKRRWSVGPALSPEDLAEKLTQRTWTLCTGFYVEGHPDYLFLNDATHEDGAQEYAVVHWCTFDGKRVGVQIESVTFSWCTEAKALELIRDLLAGQDDSAMATECYPVVEPPEQHGRCSLCM